MGSFRILPAITPADLTVKAISLSVFPRLYCTITVQYTQKEACISCDGVAIRARLDSASLSFSVLVCCFCKV